ncbi:MAG TPA: hypothetical protein VIW68_06865 [Candidatus Sulfotelmatobacter sp.]
MSIFRFRRLRLHLVSLSLLIMMAVAPLAAQSSSKTIYVVPSREAGQTNSSASTDFLPPILDFLQNTTPELKPQNSMDRSRVDQPRPQLNQFVVPHVLFGPDGQPLADNVCYSIRSYVVVRDSPHSDTTHLAGYSTCQPATRFRVRSTNGEVPPAPR